MGIRRFLLVLALLVVARTGLCVDLSELFEASSRPNVNGGLYLWGAALSGETGYGKLFNQTGNRLDFNDGFGYSRVTLLPLLRTRFRPLKDWEIRFEYWYLSESGSTVLNRPLQFGGAVYPAGTEIDSTLTAQSIDALVGYRLLSQEKFNLYLLGGFNISWFKQQVDNSAQEQLSFTQNASLFGFSVDCDITPRLAINGMAVGYLNQSILIKEYLAITDWSLQWRFLKEARLGVGYRGHWLKVENATDIFTLNLSGPYIGFSYAF